MVVLSNSSSLPGAGTVIPACNSLPTVDYLPMGWTWQHFASPNANNNKAKKSVIYIRTPPMPADQDFTVTLSSGARSDHVGLEDCDTVQHHQIQPQKFAFDKESGQIAQFGTPPCMTGTEPNVCKCITVGQDKDPNSNTPAIEMQKCGDKAFKNKQEWAMNSAGQISLVSNPKSCVDVDSGDKMLEIYSCHALGSAGNQAFTLDAATGHIEAKGYAGMCMYVRNH